MEKSVTIAKNMPVQQEKRHERFAAIVDAYQNCRSLNVMPAGDN